MRANPLRWMLALLSGVASAGCVPEQAATIPLPADLTTPALFDCADAAVRDLHRADAQWNTRITRRDPGGGVFETGDFRDSNVIGYRVQLVRHAAEPRAALRVRAAGPYFTDLGAAPALSRLGTLLGACTDGGGATR